MGLVFSNHLGRECGVVSKPSIDDRLIECFSGRGSECSGGVKNEFGVLFMPDDLLGSVMLGFWERETPNIGIEIFDAVYDDFGSVCSRSGDFQFGVSISS